MSKDVLGAFSTTSRASLGLAQSILFRRPLVPRFIKFLVKALPESDLGTTIGNLSIVLRFVGSFRYLWTSWLMGIFLDQQRLKSQNGNF